MSSSPTAAEIAGDARWLVQALDPADNVRLISMDHAAYRAASFLDDRVLQHPHEARILSWLQIAAAIPDDARSDARWIFHIGHVGSTLISRLLGELPGVLSVREPRILRDVVVRPAEARAGFAPTLRRLFSRTFHLGETALVKATSFVSEMAAELIPPGGRGLFVHASPRAYVAGILAGDNSRAELRHLEQFRRARVASRIAGLTEPAASEAHLAAQAWACEMTGLEAAAEAMPNRRLLWVDFDRMLADMAAGLAEAAGFFGFAMEPQQATALATGPLMGRYSKALEYDYSADLRRELLDEADRRHRADIDSALAMLQRAAETSPLLARALERASET